MHKSVHRIFIFLVVWLCCQKVNGQIGDIKDLASGASDLFSGCASSDLSAGCDAFNCCWDGGFHFFDFIIDHNKEIIDMRNLNPCLLSFEADANIAYSFHYSVDSGQVYKYLDYLPHIHGNLGVFSADFRYNVLTDNTNGLLNTYKTWDLILMLNFVPSDAVKFSFGSGLMAEDYTKKYYNEYYLLMEFGLFKNKDFLDLDARAAVDYNTSILPYIDAEIRYKLRFIEMPHVYAYLSFGGMFQDYYQNHQIFGVNGGIMLNIH